VSASSDYGDPVHKAQRINDGLEESWFSEPNKKNAEVKLMFANYVTINRIAIQWTYKPLDF
jgi:hypothetical protein